MADLGSTDDRRNRYGVEPLYMCIKIQITSSSLPKCSQVLCKRKELEHAKHINPHTNCKPFLKQSSSHTHSSLVPQQFSLLSGPPTAMVVFFQGEFQGQFVM